MSIRIDSDINRFKDIIRNRFKHNLGKFISSENLIGQQGKQRINIPISNIDLPRFRFGSNSGAGMGPGDIGDPSDGSKKPGKGNKAGDDESEHDFSAEFTPNELASILMEHLELPFLENKKGGSNSEKTKYNSISNQGSESLRHGKRTFKEALKRSITAGDYNPYDPRIIPIRDDKRYKSASIKESPDTNTVVIYMLDCSGSMGKEQKDIVKAEVFWIDLLLKASYKDIESVFIAHDTKAKEVSREEFFTISSNGGTRISSAYKLCSNIVEKRYPFSDWNIYPFHFTDSDNHHQDNELTMNLLIEDIIPNCNVFSYGHIKNNSSGDFVDFIGDKLSNNDKFTLTNITSMDDIMRSIKQFFEKGK